MLVIDSVPLQLALDDVVDENERVILGLEVVLDVVLSLTVRITLSELLSDVVIDIELVKLLLLLRELLIVTELVIVAIALEEDDAV
jgi:hypothetical protein